AFTRCHDTRTIRPDEPRPAALHGAFHLHHVVDGNAFGDGDDEVEAGIDALKDRIGREWGRDEHGTGGRAGLFDRLGYGVEDGHLFAGVIEGLPALAGGDAGDDLGAVVDGELGVFGAEAAGDALDEDFGVGLNEDGHGRIYD